MVRSIARISIGAFYQKSDRKRRNRIGRGKKEGLLKRTSYFVWRTYMMLPELLDYVERPSDFFVTRLRYLD